jgi:hypothetical protein
MEYDKTFYHWFGTVAPEWRFLEKGQTLDFLNVARKSCLVVPLDGDQCAALLALRSDVSSIEIPLFLFNSLLMIRLVGRKIRDAEWGGLLAAHQYLQGTALWS